VSSRGLIVMAVNLIRKSGRVSTEERATKTGRHAVTCREIETS
jgi:hypothetical protein